jgi:cytosine/adenosine deaminase-related metal-dependent hydrolase
MIEPYALSGEVLTTTGPARAAVVIRDGKIVDLLRDPRSGDLPEERRELAGSALTLDGAVRNAVRFLGVSLIQAVRMASEVPAAALGLDDKGKVAAGRDADFVLLDARGTVVETIVAGETVYEREESVRP